MCALQATKLDKNQTGKCWHYHLWGLHTCMLKTNNASNLMSYSDLILSYRLSLINCRIRRLAFSVRMEWWNGRTFGAVTSLFLMSVSWSWYVFSGSDGSWIANTFTTHSPSLVSEEFISHILTSKPIQGWATSTCSFSIQIINHPLQPNLNEGTLCSRKSTIYMTVSNNSTCRPIMAC